jgi:uncharacterized protein
VAAKDRQELKILKDGLEVQLILVPMTNETGGHLVPSSSELEVWIREQDITSVLDLPAIQKAIDKASEGLTAEAIVSRGTAPKPGKDGYIEYLIDFGIPLTPDLSDRGNIDLRASLIRNVAVGQPLAFVHPPTFGESGINVYGKIIASKPGKQLEPRLGPNVQKSPNDLTLIIAQTGGHARLMNGLLEVQECYIVPTDIDYGTGNVTFGKAVMIDGDVKAGFSVEAGGDLEISGQVEDCQIKSLGKIFIRGGFTGQGKGLVQARGEVTIGHIRNQHAKSEQSIIVLKEAVNSRLQARHSIAVNGLLAGGKVQAKLAIECTICGTETGTTTHIEVGHDFTIVAEVTAIRVEMDKMGKYAKKLGDALHQIQEVEKLNRSLEPRNIEVMFELEIAKSKIEAKIKALRDRFAFLEKQENAIDKATITVLKKVFPGVIVKIGRDVFLVNEIMQGPKTFFSKDGVIKFR